VTQLEYVAACDGVHTAVLGLFVCSHQPKHVLHHAYACSTADPSYPSLPSTSHKHTPCLLVCPVRHSLQSLKSGLGILPVGQAKQSEDRRAGTLPLVTGRTVGQRLQGTWPAAVAIP
jgi:hypothetical protein